MNVKIEPGKYVVAVSGGVDSVVLLDCLNKNKKLDLIIAHFDHGIREDSVKDRKFVEGLAKKYDLVFEFEGEELGADASEELARTRRYKFLESVMKSYKAKAIVTAHHKDDVLETAIFNLLRGTGRSGLSSLKTTDKIIRPLLQYKKSELLDYACKNNLQWLEDPTNKSLKYTRNKIRKFLAEVPTGKKQKLEEIIGKNTARNLEMDTLIQGIFNHGYDSRSHSFDRTFYISLPHKIASELVVFWLKKLGSKYDKKLVEKLVNNLKVLPNGAKTDVDKNHYFELSAKQISMRRRTPV